MNYINLYDGKGVFCKMVITIENGISNMRLNPGQGCASLCFHALRKDKDLSFLIPNSK